ncbi:MAG: hypothetical protein PHS17_08455 [Desulfobacterales bacterium]|nr:hypothetical protein [Desulfobacterales bacterium]
MNSGKAGGSSLPPTLPGRLGPLIAAGSGSGNSYLCTVGKHLIFLLNLFEEAGRFLVTVLLCITGINLRSLKPLQCMVKRADETD